MIKVQLFGFLLALLACSACAQIIVTSDVQEKQKIHLLNSDGMKISTEDLTVGDKKLSDIREELKTKLGNSEFTFLRPINKDDEDKIMASDILSGSVIIILKDQPKQNFDNLKNLLPTGTFSVPATETSSVAAPVAAPTIAQKTVQTKTYPQGTYTGEFVDGVRSGQGKFCFNSGDCYEGQWNQDKWNGQGTYKFTDSSSVSGKWVNGELVGNAVVLYSNGNRYQGPVKDFNPHGKGVLVTASYKYTGDFVLGSLTGSGKLQFTSGSSKGNVYVGQVTNGILNGKGKLTLASGDSYDGSWVANKRSGYGTHYQGNQILYQGEWSNDKYNGKGTYYDLKGNIKLQGTFLNGELHGKVIITQPDGTTQERTYNRGNPV